MSKQKDSDRLVRIEVSDTTLNSGKYTIDENFMKVLSESNCIILFKFRNVEYKISSQDLDIKDVMKKLNVTEDNLNDVILSIKIEKFPKISKNEDGQVSEKYETITNIVDINKIPRMRSINENGKFHHTEATSAIRNLLFKFKNINY